MVQPTCFTLCDFFLLFFSLEWPEIHVHFSLIVFHQSFNRKLRWDSPSFLAMAWPEWSFLYKGRLSQEELVANLPTASLPPTAKQQRYLCHCESLHLWSVISCCSWLISCRAAGKAAVQLSQGWTWTHLLVSCSTLSLACQRRAGNMLHGTAVWAFSVGCFVHEVGPAAC